MLEVRTRGEALARGRAPAEVDALVRSGRWLALRRGVYLTGPALPDDPAVAHALLVAAAAKAVSVPSVGSHASAAVVHGLPLLVPVPAEPVLSRLRPPAQPRPDGRRGARLVSSVPASHATLLHSAPVTTLARTAADLARTSGPVQAVVVLDAALARVERREVEQVLRDQRGWPGSQRARQHLAFADPRAESPLESVGRLRMAQLGLPAPDLQRDVHDARGFVGRVDFLWEAQRTVGEADGRVKYADEGALWREKRREDRLRDAGFEVVRFDWDTAVRRPAVLRDLVLRAFARARTRAA